MTSVPEDKDEDNFTIFDTHLTFNLQQGANASKETAGGE